jgi:hypothetical protein
VGPRAARSQLLAAALAAMAVVIMAACATTVQQEIANEPPTSVETLPYFPFQVKGYQNSGWWFSTPCDAIRGAPVL